MMSRHPGHIDRPGASWRVRMSVGGKRHTWMLDPAEYPTRQSVEEFALEKGLELRRRNGKGLPGPMAFSELLDRFE